MIVRLILWWSCRRDTILTREILRRHGMGCRDLSVERSLHVELRYWLVKLKRHRALRSGEKEGGKG